MADTFLTRRTLFGAMAIAPVVLAAPAAAFGSSEFERALAAYRHERKAFDVARTDAEGNAACEHIDCAFLRLLKAPARNGADIAAKIDAFLVEYEDSIMDEDRLKLIAEDARRLGRP